MKTPIRIELLSSSISEPMFQVVDADGRLICDNEPYYPHAVSEQDQRHIVACVNACAGLNPEAVPEVVEALREAINWADGYAQGGVIPEYLKAARAALAKLEDVS